MDFVTCMHIFVKAAELGSFSQTATICNMNKPSVSRHIKRLEEELGTSLFHRTTRKIELTDAGKVFYEKSLDILNYIRDAKQITENISDDVSGKLRISAHEQLFNKHIRGIIPEFMDKYPRISVHLEAYINHDTALKHDTDLKIMLQRPDQHIGYVKKITSNNYIICASPEYFTSQSHPKDPGDLINHNCITQSQNGTEKWAFASARTSVIEEVEVSGKFSSNDMVAILEIIFQSSGIARLPTWLVGPLVHRGQLVRTLSMYDTTPEDSGIYIVSKDKSAASSKTRVFIEFLEKYLGKPPIWEQL